MAWNKIFGFVATGPGLSSVARTSSFCPVMHKNSSRTRDTGFSNCSFPRAALAVDRVPTSTDTPSRRPDVSSQPALASAPQDALAFTDNGLPLSYDLPAISAYWDARPGASAKRLAQVTGLFTPWILKVGLDSQLGKADTNSGKRAAELREILVELGPCFVKLGQALSVRPDLIGPDAMNELRFLCDAVPSFDSGLAFQMIEEELGAPVHEIFSELSPEPIAAASLGQVHKGRLRKTGETVAVKVQRPDMLRKVSLDLYCLQAVAKFATNTQNRFTANRTDYLGLLNEWASGTYKELDYCNEANNSRKFATLVHTKLPDVYVPRVYDQYTSRKILTMEWVEGKKLSDCSPAQIKSLVNKGVECFLFQLLSAGFFHSDPHSANLLCLESGQLCIIDFGLMSTIEKDEMDAMVRAIIDLANRNYKGVVHDFVKLKFLPDDDKLDLEAVEKSVGAILDQALEGGGAKSINFQTLSDELAHVTFDFPFQIPPTFALLLRALSVLEGIALIGDPKFKLIMESFPFVSRLVLTDRSPALREALREVLYKDGKFSSTRLRVLLDSSQGLINEGDAFVDFDTVSTQSSLSRDALDLLFSEDGFVLRDILSEEIAKALDILARDMYERSTSLFQRSIPAPLIGFVSAMSDGASARFGSSAGMNIGETIQWLLLPGKLSFALPPVSNEELSQLDAVRDMMGWLAEEAQTNGTDILRLLPDVMAKSGVLSRMVVGRVGEKLASRLFQDLIRGGGEQIGSKRRVPNFR